MTSPRTLSNQLLDTYVLYENTPFWLRSPTLRDEREALLRQRGMVHQAPFVELLPGYRRIASTLVHAAHDLGISADAAAFLRAGLFGGADVRLYTHQAEATRLAMEPMGRGGSHVVATSGTGSGKTECFFIPIVARLIEESSRWPRPGRAPSNWWEGDGSFERKRAQETRHPALRALIVYPLNALVEDQMVRLRKMLDSDEAQSWLRTNRNGNRFYFGGYNGRTPVAGPIEPTREGALRDHLRRLGQERLALPFDERALLPDPAGAELASRWDMQNDPPDVLVTNFSMLNIMLLRHIEAPIFEQTRAWLAEDERNVFTLVVDELHSYRGTPGTEVALVLRMLLSRLGLTPESPQLRIVATSASLDDDARGRQFLSEFFGCDGARFTVLPGEGADPVGGPPAVPDITPLLPIFSAFDEAAHGEATQAALRGLAINLGCDPSAPKESIGTRLSALGVPQLLTRASERNSRGTPVATSIDILSSRVAAALGVPPGDSLESAASGLVQACAEATTTVDGTPVPILGAKVHLFFRNLPGLWACVDPNCSSVIVRGPRNVGRLYLEPRIECECGARVLDLYYCQDCGEALLGGYRTERSDGSAEFHLSPEFPDLDSVPDMGRQDKTLNEYTLFWPGSRTPVTGHWTVAGRTIQWYAGFIEPASGLVRRMRMPGLVSGQYLLVDSPDAADLKHKAVPKYCPHCDSMWAYQFGRDGEFKSPVRGLRTAFTKIAQILADRLLVEGSEREDEHKLVSFSDNRREAAELARDLENNHYQDLMRSLLMHASRENALVARYSAYERQLRPEALNLDEQAHAHQFAVGNPIAASGMAMERVGAPLTPEQAQALDRLRRQMGIGLPLRELWRTIEIEFVSLGVNPAGIGRWANRRGQTPTWQAAYAWTPSGSALVETGAIPDIREHRRAMVDVMVNYALQSLFSGRGRSLEDIGLGWITFDASDESIGSLTPALSRQVADAAIRVLGQTRAFQYRLSPFELQSLFIQKPLRAADDPPRALRDYLREIARRHSCNFDQLVRDLYDWLSRSRAIDGYLVLDDGLVFHEAEAHAWQCTNCSQVHLQPAGGVCTSCTARLPAAPGPIPPATDDFYAQLAQDPRTRGRLHCEELTGQTDQFDAFHRLRLFKGIYRTDEQPRVEIIDVLNVTTTMEAGVDIGDLRMVMMANMPPERFNYQQRAGRCGRRSQGLSFVLTFCKGRSHDDHYFSNLNAMTAAPPPPPYLDLRRVQIAQRVLASEVLRRAFIATGAGTAAGDYDSVHGQYGARADWLSVRPSIVGWLSTSRGEIEDIVGILAHGAPGLATQRDAMISYAADGGLLAAIDRAVGDSTEEWLSQALAWQGVLPMFGFPTGIRNLYHEKPRFTRGRWVERVIERDIEIAISEFAPGADLVKDKDTHHSIGVAHWIRRMVRGTPRADLAPNLFGTPQQVSYCRNCLILHESAPDVCPHCGQAADEAAAAVHRRFQLLYPAGFRTDFRPREGGGADEDRTYASSARPVISPAESRIIGHARSHFATGNFYTINDNNRQLFSFDEARGFNGWIESSQRAATTFDFTGTRETGALAARKTSECVVIEPPSIDPELQFRVKRVGVRSALYSFAFLLQRAAAVELDVDQREFSIGIRALRDGAADYVRGQVYLADTLANGAGYARHLYASDSLQRIVEDVARGAHSTLLHGMADHFSDPGRCDGACYGCIRSYQNLRYHPLLDWRLGFDVSRLLALGEIPGLPDSRWEHVLSRGVHALGGGFEPVTAAGLPAARHIELGTLAVFSHPLHNRYPDATRSTLPAEAHVELEGRYPGSAILHFTYFDLTHRPWWVVGQLLKGEHGEEE